MEGASGRIGLRTVKLEVQSSPGKQAMGFLLCSLSWAEVAGFEPRQFCGFPRPHRYCGASPLSSL
jgi:hypothetical protein